LYPHLVGRSSEPELVGVGPGADECDLGHVGPGAAVGAAGGARDEVVVGHAHLAQRRAQSRVDLGRNEQKKSIGHDPFASRCAQFRLTRSHTKRNTYIACTYIYTCIYTYICTPAGTRPASITRFQVRAQPS